MSQEFYDCISEWADRCGELQKQLAAKERELDICKANVEMCERDVAGLIDKLRESNDKVDHLTSQLATVEAQYHDLIYQVGNKYSHETRHETAKRYLQEAEAPDLTQSAEQQAHAAHDASSKEE